MNKIEAKIKLKELGDKGYLTHSLLLEIFEDDNEIPEYIWNILITDPRELRQPILIITGPEGSKVFKEAIEKLN